MNINEHIKYTHKFPIIDSDDDIYNEWDVGNIPKPSLRCFTSSHVDTLELDSYFKSMNSEPNFDIELSPNSAIHRPQGKKGSYDGIKFDSIWEYAYYRYTKEVKGEFIERNTTENLPYFVNGKECKFYPDFKTAEGFVEVKGIWRERDLQKQAAHPEVKFLDSTQIKPIMKELNKAIPSWKRDYVC